VDLRWVDWLLRLRSEVDQRAATTNAPFTPS
jgi:hypothetical protein